MKALYKKATTESVTSQNYSQWCPHLFLYFEVSSEYGYTGHEWERINNRNPKSISEKETSYSIAVFIGDVATGFNQSLVTDFPYFDVMSSFNHVISWVHLYSVTFSWLSTWQLICQGGLRGQLA